MAAINLQHGDLSLRVSTRGGIILGFWWSRENGDVPLLRAAASDDADALSSSCYPLVPFGNRVKENRFSFEGKEYVLTANTAWDPHYLHGDGWKSEWSIVSQGDSNIELAFTHEGGHTPYRYRASQLFRLSDAGLEIRLSVTNLGDDALPFGLGWHPYFPMTPETTLLAPAKKFWTEVEGWLPGEATDIPDDLNFRSPSGLPHRWVNNGFEDWSGEALISWPEKQAEVHLTADPLFKHAFIFVSDTKFDPSFKRDYFCFEPMSHLSNGHNLLGLGDLKVLEPSESLSGAIQLKPQAVRSTSVPENVHAC